MHLTWRDGVATVFVGAGVVLYGLWLAGTTVPGFASGRAVAALVFGLGLAASVTAVVYGVGAGLLRAPKTYLVFSSLIGLAALIGGVIALVNGNEAMLATLVGTNGALWLMSTLRHAVTSETRSDAINDSVPRAA